MRPPTNQPTNQHLAALTGLRIIAALHVVIYHFGQELFVAGPRWLYNIVDAGYVGVSLFFILSGFILTYVYLDPKGEKQINARSFWLARFARVYPVYVLGLLVYLPAFIDAIARGTLTPFTTLLVSSSVPTATQAWVPQAVCQWNCPAWSVSTEAFFYLVFPFSAAVLLPRIDVSKTGRALGIMAALWMISLAPPAVYDFIDSIRPIPAETSNWLLVVKFNPLVRLPEFLFGIVLGKFFLLNGARAPLDRRWGSWLSVAATTVIVGVLAFNHHLSHLILHNGLLAPIFAMLIYALAIGGGPIAWLLSLRPIVFLGEVSYAIYILHFPVWVWLVRWQLQLGLGIDTAHSPGYLLFYLVVLCAISSIVFRWFEIPARDLIRRGFAKRPPKDPVERRPKPIFSPVLGISATTLLIGGGIGFIVGHWLVPMPAASAPALHNIDNLLSQDRFTQGIEGSGWQPISGSWEFENGNLVQREVEGYDHVIAFTQTFPNYGFRVSLTHLQGSGGGVLFNMPQSNSKDGAHLVRYTDEGTGIFYGHYDENGIFTDQGFAATLPPEKRVRQILEVIVGSETYSIRINGRELANGIPLISTEGYIGLTSSVSTVAFDSTTVLGSNGGQIAAPTTADNGDAVASPAATTPALNEGDLLTTLEGNGDLVAAGWTPFSGDWAFQDGALVQSQREGFDRAIGYQGAFSDYTLSTTLRHIEGTGGGVLFNMPQPDSKNGAHMVRFSEDDEVIFWGYYDENGDFTGQGSANVEAPGTEPHTIEVRAGQDTYTVVLDGETIVEDVALQSGEGHVGLTSSASVVVFERVEVLPEAGTSTE